MAEQRWTKEFQDAKRMADDIASRIEEANAGGLSRTEKSRQVAAARRNIVKLGNKISSLDNQLQTGLRSQISDTELCRRQDLIIGLRFRMKQMSTNLSSSGVSSRDDLFSDASKGPPVETNRTAGLDNYGLISYQHHTMKEQDEELNGLEESVKSTKHIALTVNEELDLHNRLLEDIDQHADYTDSQLRRVHRRLVTFTKRAGSSRSLGCMCLMLLSIVVLILIVLRLVKVW